MIIFLDVDGVLHPLNERHLPSEADHDEIIARADCDTAVDPDSGLDVAIVLKGEFLPRCCQVLGEIVAAANGGAEREKYGEVRIVLSSTWRETLPGRRAVDAQLRAAGLPPCTGFTPTLAGVGRAREIWRYLEENHPPEAGGFPPFVVLDDNDFVHKDTPHGEPADGDAGARLAQHFVHVDKSRGLCPEDASVALRILQTTVTAAEDAKDREIAELRAQVAKLEAAKKAEEETTIATRRLPPLRQPDLDEAQAALYSVIVDSRVAVLGKDVIFDEEGGLRGPWNAELTSPDIGKHMERLGAAVRAQNSLEARLYEVAILATGAHWHSQFEWWAHEKLAKKAGVNPVAIELMKRCVPPEEMGSHLPADELAVYALTRELNATKRVSPATYAATKLSLTAPGDSVERVDRKMADLSMTIGCYHAVCCMLNMFEVPVPIGQADPLADPSAAQ